MSTYGSMSDSDLRRFYAKVALPNDEGCMLWLASTRAKGYGQVYLNGGSVRAHRVACYLAHGMPALEQTDAAHSCRNTNCVAPAHLRWATPAENQADRLRDGTHNRGERHPFAKLTAEDVQAIRISPERVADLAIRYGVNRSAIYQLRRGERWGHLANSARSA